MTLSGSFRIAALAMATLAACASEPTPLPTQAAIESLDRESQPPLYQMLYDAPVLPKAQIQQQRVRLLIWLKHMGLGANQLDTLEELRQVAQQRRQAIAAAEQELALVQHEEEQGVYQQIWVALSKGASVDDPVLSEAATLLNQAYDKGDRERQLLQVRLEGIRSVLEAEQTFLRSLTPRQEQLMADSVFFLRHRLDPVGNPGDFRALVGSTYDPGQYAVLTRGLGDVPREPLNIGGLWSDEPALNDHPLHDARREVLLYLALMEPGLEDAIKVARSIAGMKQAGQNPQPGRPGGSGPAPQAPPP